MGKERMAIKAMKRKQRKKEPLNDDSNLLNGNQPEDDAAAPLVLDDIEAPNEWRLTQRMTLRSHRFIDVPVMTSLPIRIVSTYRTMTRYPLRMTLISLAETSDSHFL